MPITDMAQWEALRKARFTPKELEAIDKETEEEHKALKEHKDGREKAEDV
jgi:hypothetical protein